MVNDVDEDRGKLVYPKFEGSKRRDRTKAGKRQSKNVAIDRNGEVRMRGERYLLWLRSCTASSLALSLSCSLFFYLCIYY